MPAELILAAGMAVAGGTLNTIGWWQGIDSQIDGYKDQLKRLKAERKQNLESLAFEFQMEREAQREAADDADRATTRREVSLANETENSLQSLILGQEAAGKEHNARRAAAAKSEGAALAQSAQSGARSSSVQDAIALEAAENAKQMDFEAEMNRRQNGIALKGILNGLANNVFQIQESRTAAHRTRLSFDGLGFDWLDESGNKIGEYSQRSEFGKTGRNYSLFKNSLLNNLSSYNRTITGVNDAIDDLKDSRTGGKGFMNGLAAFFGGAQQGVQVSTNVQNLVSKLGYKSFLKDK